ncbi:Hypothetical predicted protein [Octopus vulgaris]|uniref:Uncharacterized protein n=1 Tax=Octopus vulgaris TaxID=6645 RepID=A0AA36BN40_OCTVU|nr:Hypothetical predicted protein [Octopus vulgaris]
MGFHAVSINQNSLTRHWSAQGCGRRRLSKVLYSGIELETMSLQSNLHTDVYLYTHTHMHKVDKDREREREQDNDSNQGGKLAESLARQAKCLVVFCLPLRSEFKFCRGRLCLSSFRD